MTRMRELLQTLSRQTLVKLVDDCGLQAKDRRAKASLVDSLVAKRPADWAMVLKKVTVAELKNACKASGISPVPRSKGDAIAALIDAAADPAAGKSKSARKRSPAAIEAKATKEPKAAKPKATKEPKAVKPNAAKPKATKAAASKRKKSSKTSVAAAANALPPAAPSVAPSSEATPSRTDSPQKRRATSNGRNNVSISKGDDSLTGRLAPITSGTPRVKARRNIYTGPGAPPAARDDDAASEADTSPPPQTQGSGERASNGAQSPAAAPDSMPTNHLAEVGLRWGQKRDDVREALQGRLSLQCEQTTDHGLTVEQQYTGQFGGFDAETVSASFYRGRLFAVSVLLRRATQPPARSLWQQVVDSMTERYGVPASLQSPRRAPGGRLGTDRKSAPPPGTDAAEPPAPDASSDPNAADEMTAGWQLDDRIARLDVDLVPEPQEDGSRTLRVCCLFVQTEAFERWKRDLRYRAGGRRRRRRRRGSPRPTR